MWINIEFGAICVTPQYMPNDEIQPGWFEENDPAVIEQYREQFAPPPPPLTPDYNAFQLATVTQYAAIIDGTTASAGMVAALQNCIARMPLTPEAAPLFVGVWNAVVGAIPDVSGIDWQEVVDAANLYHCPVFQGLDVETGLLPTP